MTVRRAADIATGIGGAVTFAGALGLLAVLCTDGDAPMTAWSWAAMGAAFGPILAFFAGGYVWMALMALRGVWRLLIGRASVFAEPASSPVDPVLWVVIGNDGEPGYIADLGGDETNYDVGPSLAAELRERDAALVRYVPTSRATEQRQKQGPK